MTKLLGQQGEAFVCKYLCGEGYRILEKNYSNRYGELDIIAKEAGELCFIEVKTRSDRSYGDPLESITRFKRNSLIRMAKMYMADHDIENMNARFDVVAVLGNPVDEPKLEIIKNAFELGPHQ